MPRKKPYVHSQLFPFITSTQVPPWNLQQPLIYFLSLWTCLLWIVHINGFIHYVQFYNWLLRIFLGFIHVVKYQVLNFFLWPNNIPFYGGKHSIVWTCHILFMYSSVDGTFGSFIPYMPFGLWIMLWTFCVQDFVDTFSSQLRRVFISVKITRTGISGSWYLFKKLERHGDT